MTEQKKWYVLYTKPFWEKRVVELIGKIHRLEAWTPLSKKKQQWSDRVKTIETPYFRNYVFIHATDKERLKVFSTDGVLNYVSFDGNPATIRAEQIESIKSFITEHSNVVVESLSPGDLVRVQQGVFEGMHAIVKRIDGIKAVLVLEQLGCIMTAELPVLQKVS